MSCCTLMENDIALDGCTSISILSFIISQIPTLSCAQSSFSNTRSHRAHSHNPISQRARHHHPGQELSRHVRRTQNQHHGHAQPRRLGGEVERVLSLAGGGLCRRSQTQFILNNNRLMVSAIDFKSAISLKINAMHQSAIRAHHVYRTSQAFTTINGPPYIAIISGTPLHAAHAKAAAATNATPMSLW